MINDTLINNIVLFSEDKDQDMKKLDEIVKLLNLENLLKNNVIIGDKGKGLSGVKYKELQLQGHCLKIPKYL